MWSAEYEQTDVIKPEFGPSGLDFVHMFCMNAKRNCRGDEDVILLAPPGLVADIRCALDSAPDHRYLIDGSILEFSGCQVIITNAVKCLTATFVRPIIIY